MALEMDHFTLQSRDHQLSWCSLLAFLGLQALPAEFCSKGRGGQGWKAFPCTGPKAPCLSSSTGRRAELEGMQLHLGRGVERGFLPERERLESSFAQDG